MVTRASHVNIYGNEISLFVGVLLEFDSLSAGAYCIVGSYASVVSSVKPWVSLNKPGIKSKTFQPRLCDGRVALDGPTNTCTHYAFIL